VRSVRYRDGLIPRTRHTRR